MLKKPSERSAAGVVRQLAAVSAMQARRRSQIPGIGPIPARWGAIGDAASVQNGPATVSLALDPTGRTSILQMLTRPGSHS